MCKLSFPNRGRVELRTCIVLALLLVGATAMLWGQDDSSRQSQSQSLGQSLSQSQSQSQSLSLSQSQSQDESGRSRKNPLNVEPESLEPGADLEIPGQTVLPADRIIEILTQRPELLDSLRTMAAKRMEDQGRSVSPAEITDDVLFSRIEQDANLRVLITEQLRSKGYLSQADLESLGTFAPDAPPPRLRRVRPAKKLRENAEPPADQSQPETTQRPSPYPDLPALRDLYRQIPSQNGVLRRFGADIFKNGTGNTESLPMDLPAGPDYVLGPGDGLNINTWGSLSQRFTRTVDREGQLPLPEVGNLLVAGQTLADAQKAIERSLRTQFRDVKVDVSLTRLRTIRVYVVGDVESPGAYDISSLSTPLNALYAAGGPTARGSLRTVRHYRGDRLVREVDLYDLLLRGVRSDVENLQAGDTILVPPVGAQVTVAGMVKRPAIYELKSEERLSDVLELAGGVMVSATLRQITVERIEAHQRRVLLSVSLPQSNDKDTTAKPLDKFFVQDGDRVRISPILPYSDGTVYVEGHVFRPGKYSYHPGLQISDVIRSYQDMLPEPADHAEIVRLVPPDYHPEVLEFKLSEVITGDDPIELQPFDTIRIFGRYEIDAPRVSIFGEVLRPGQYPLTQGMKASELVRMAGGFKRSAFTARADIASYVVQNGARIRTKHETVDVAKALAGEAGADLVLKPGDVLTIHQLAGWRDIGASVTVNGEMQYPGTYGIEDGERLSTLLKRAGGFRANAYPEGAILERVQVRELAENRRQQLMQRIEAAGATPKVSAATSVGEQAAVMQAALQQRQHILAVLRSQPASGRLVIKISPDIQRWQNTAADIELRAGDVLTIPKKPNFVLVSGQVYNASALSYTPGRNAGWYLNLAGGPTDLANKKDIYIIRANGSVVGQSGGGWWKGSVLSTAMQPGDTLVVPEKIISGTPFWKSALTIAQFMSSIAVTAKIALD